MDWPEQEVRIVEEEFSPAVRNVSYRVLENGVKQMVVQIPRLDNNEQADALLTVEVRRRPILAPLDAEILAVPARPQKQVRRFLGVSPFIESRNSQIRALARTIIKDKTTAWQRVEAIYDYVRENIQYQESELKGAVQTLRDGQGDCEAMTSLFIALCRANKIPARMVWVTDHSYPEFYLVDDQNQGHWLPCQVSGARAFGEMPETRVILQKGDNIRIPETKQQRRYVAVQLKAAAVRGASPSVTEIMEFVPVD
jgi:transglutaminase-like putative cysteine protease